jgi:nucleoside-diphosphate-sugar epimerase
MGGEKMKILFIGGTGIISSACSELAVEKGFTLYHLNRGRSHRKTGGVNQIIGDIRNKEEVKNVLKDSTFDVVVNWISFTTEHIMTDLEIFKGKTGQYIFISSASAYQKPPEQLPITEDTPLDNPFWQYSRDKIACEKLLMEEYKKNQFPATIVRPSHTYDKTLLPTDWGYTVIDRMKKGKNTVIHGDGTSLWTMTHHRDFAKGFVGLLGNSKAIGEAFHITSDELLPWNKIYELMARELGVKLNPVHVPSDFIAQIDPRMGGSLLGDKAHSMIFDNSKIKRFVPEFKATIKFEEGVKEIIKWYRENPDWQVVNPETDAMIEEIIIKYSSKV